MKKQIIDKELLQGLRLAAFFVLLLSAFSGMANAEPGDVLWEKTQYYVDFETPIGDTILFECTALETTPDGGCIVSAFARSTSIYINAKAYLIKLDENGDTQWTQYYGWGDYHYYTQTVLVDPDGGYVLAGDIQSPYYEIPPSYAETGAFLIKVDANGDTLWTARYNDSPGTYSYSVRDIFKTPDSGYALIGHTIKVDNYTIWDGFIIKADADGREMWTKHYPAPTDEPDPTWLWSNMIGLTGCLSHDGGFILSGGIQMIYSDGPYNRIIWDNGAVIKTDADGEVITTFTFGEHDQIFDVIPTSDGGYFIGDLNRDIFSSQNSEFIDQGTALKIDGSLNESWNYNILFDGGNDTGYDTSGTCRAVCEVLGNGGYIAVGEKYWFDEDSSTPMPVFNAQLYLVHFTNEGVLDTLRLYEEEFGPSAANPVLPRAIKVKENGNYLICGQYQQVNNNEGRLVFPKRGFVAEIEGFGTASVDDDNFSILPAQVSLMQNYPNPFNATTQIQFSLNTSDDVTLSVYDLLGRKITTLYDGALNAGTHSITWNGTNESGEVVSSGMYFYRLETSKNTINKQMLLLK